MNILTKEVAQQFLDEQIDDLSSYETIEPDAAKCLRKHKGPLDLGGLIDLSDTAAQHLSKHKGNLALDGLTSLSDTTAGHLGRHLGNLHLNGITRLSSCAAAHLGKHGDGGFDYLGLNGLTKLQDEVAQGLCKHQGPLDLNGLTQLAPPVAKHFAQHEGNLSLNGLVELPDAVAKHLGPHRGSLCLNGLTSLSDAAAECLSEHKEFLELNRLTALSETAACCLGRHDGSIDLNGLTSLSDAAASALAKHKVDDLSLNGLRELSEPAAKSLGEHQGYCLRLRSLKSLSDSAAGNLSKHKGPIELDNLTDLSDAARAWLDSAPGGCRLPDALDAVGTKQVSSFFWADERDVNILKGDPSEFFAFFDAANIIYDMGEAYGAVDYLLREALPNNALSGFVLEGGECIKDSVDWDGFPSVIRVFEPARCVQLSDLLEGLTENAFVSCFNAERMNRHEVYPEDWDGFEMEHEDGPARLFDVVDEIRELLNQANRANQHLVVALGVIPEDMTVQDYVCMPSE